jgi:hypothetical protein
VGKIEMKRIPGIPIERNEGDRKEEIPGKKLNT